VDLHARPDPTRRTVPVLRDGDPDRHRGMQVLRLMADALFDIEPTPAEPAGRLSADRRRTIRQTQALAGRCHPLSLTAGHPIRLHPDAPTGREGTGPRCGDCWYLTVWTHHDRRYLKCGYDTCDFHGRRWHLVAQIIHGPDDPGNHPDYPSRVALATSIINHRLNTADPDVADVLRALEGWSVADLAEPPR
jgi:hypothetical protein